MKKVKIITDSCADLTAEQLTRYDIDYAKMSTVYKGVETPALLTWTDDEVHALYDIMRNGNRITTAQVSVEEFQRIFELYLKQDMDIVYIGCSSKSSGSVNTGFVTAKKLMEKYEGSTIVLCTIHCHFVFVAERTGRAGIVRCGRVMNVVIPAFITKLQLTAAVAGHCFGNLVRPFKLIPNQVGIVSGNMPGVHIAIGIVYLKIQATCDIRSGIPVGLTPGTQIYCVVNNTAGNLGIFVAGNNNVPEDLCRIIAVAELLSALQASLLHGCGIHLLRLLFYHNGDLSIKVKGLFLLREMDSHDGTDGNIRAAIDILV